jgi:adenylate cyclase class 2
MQTEIEAKWLNINLDDFRKKLETAGAKLIEPERLMIRSVFDYPDGRLYKVGGWVRVRNEGNKTTMSYKQLNDRTLHGTKEITLKVDSFEEACRFLRTIGLKSKSLQETKRESWKLGNVEIELDTWPWIPSHVELEASSEKELKKAAQKLDLDFTRALHGSVETAYQAVYDVTELEINHWEEIRFIDVPDWLEKKRK